MATKPLAKNLLPSNEAQNPAPFTADSQGRKDAIRFQVDRIIEAFHKLTPSNYAAQVVGPYYTLQFQAAAEQIAEFQIAASEILADGMYDYTRTEVLHQILGALVFPDANTTGYPAIDGDTTYRAFLKQMVALLLQGATKATVKSGVELLTTATVTVLERGIEARKLKGGTPWGSVWDQFTFEVTLEQDGGTKLPAEDVFVLQRNVDLVLRALKPAHTLYDYRHLFREVLVGPTEHLDTDYRDYKYQDARRHWIGTKEISGSHGVTWADKTLFSDTSRDFSHVLVGATLAIPTGGNSVANASAGATYPDDRLEGCPGHYRVTEVLCFPIPNDPIPRRYTSGNVTGRATVSNGDAVTDPLRDWNNTVEGQTLTFLEGPNAGTYRLKAVLGLNGGSVGTAGLSGTRVKIAPTLLRVKPRMPVATTGQPYKVTLDRLGVQMPRVVTDEVPSSIDTVHGKVRTQHGPLVKTWGDATPATVADVSVTINAVAAIVTGVNPYTGEITTSTPMVEGVTILVSYAWLAAPVLELTGLNTDGLGLNQWDRAITGYHDNGAVNWAGWDTRNLNGVIPFDKRGAVSTARFPMGVVLGPSEVLQPVFYGHRYMGYEKAYSSLLNSPTTLALNTDPNKYELPAFANTVSGTVGAYEGTALPDATWAQIGTSGTATVENGTLLVNDTVAGSFAPTGAPCRAYTQGIDLSVPMAVTLVTRYQVESTTPDGVFSGVGFGFHDGKRLYLVGNLLINGLEHVGLLTDARNPHLLASWKLGPQVEATITSPTTMTLPNNPTVPTDFAVGKQFQILAPQSQAGTYTATQVSHYADGTLGVTVTPPFPQDPTKWGNKKPAVLFATPWRSKPTTYRLTAIRAPTATKWFVRLALSGATTSVLTIEVDAFGADLPLPAETSLALFTKQDALASQRGEVLWGALSYGAKNKTRWSFIRYGTVPDIAVTQGHTKVVNTGLGTLPENATTPAWYLTQAFGTSKADGHITTLKSTSGSDTLNTAFAYGRDEPYLTKTATLDLTARFRTDAGVLGAGDAEIVLNDGVREVRVATLLYREDAHKAPYRQLVQMPSISFAGLAPLTDQGWIKVTGDVPAVNHENDVLLTQAEIDDGTIPPSRYTATLDLPSLDMPDGGGRVLEATLAFDSAYTPLGGTDTGVYFVGDVNASANRAVAVTFVKVGGVAKVRLAKRNNLVAVQDYVFNWADGGVHTYKAVALDGVVSLTIDGSVQVPTVNVLLFGAEGTGAHTATFGCLADKGTGTTTWRALSYTVLPDEATAKRTIGVYLGGDKTDLNSWEVPRTDSTAAVNTDEVGPAIEEMDWREWMELRVLRTNAWGVTVYRPDLALPPYYVAEDGVTQGIGFATETTEPSAGWINVEYRKLPYVPSKMGFIGFGAFDPQAITEQRWNYLNFRLFANTTDDWKAPQHMVLNQANVITSGEPALDDTLETVVVTPLADGRRVSLKPTHIYAHGVYKVVDGATILTGESYTFDVAAQLLTLKGSSTFTGSAVSVVFYPAKPYTSTYLEAQGLLDSMTLLNEGTPPVPKQQAGADTKSVYVDGEYKAVTWALDPAALYENLTFMVIGSGGGKNLITTVGESTVGNQIATSGTSFTEQHAGPKPYPFAQGGGASGKTLFASGGNYNGAVVDGSGKIIGAKPLGGTLGPGTAILYPNYRRGTVVKGTGVGATNRETHSDLRYQAVLTDGVGLVSELLQDTVPPPNDTAAPTEPANFVANPSGAPAAKGSVYAVLQEAGAFAHVGPWGGQDALAIGPNAGNMAQKSILGGGNTTLTNGIHDPTKGMVALGGNLLPQGQVTKQTIVWPP